MHSFSCKWFVLIFEQVCDYTVQCVWISLIRLKWKRMLCNYYVVCKQNYQFYIFKMFKENCRVVNYE